MGRTWRRAVLDEKDVGELVEGRFRVAISPLLVLLVCVSMLLVPIGYAYAYDFEGGGGASQSFDSSFGTVWYGPTASGLYVRYGVVANTRYDAAVYCCRGRSFELSELSNSKKSKLINNGDFKQFAELFNASKPELTDDWSGDAAIVMAWNSAKQLYGETYCWNARYTNDQKIRAQEAIEDVLNDDDPSGGGGFGNTSNGNYGEYTLIEVKPYKSGGPDIDYVAIKTSEYNKIKSNAESNGYTILAIEGRWANDSGTNSVMVVSISSDNFRFKDSNYSVTVPQGYTAYGVEDSRAVTITEIGGHKCAVSSANAKDISLSNNLMLGTRPIFYRNMKDDGSPEVPGPGGGGFGNTVNEASEYTLIEVKPYKSGGPDIDYVAIKKSEYDKIKSNAESNGYTILAIEGGWADDAGTTAVMVVSISSDNFIFKDADYSVTVPKGYTAYGVEDKSTVTITEIGGYKCAVSSANAKDISLYNKILLGTRPIFYRNMKDDGSPEVPGPGGGGGDEPTEPPIGWPNPPTETPQPPEVPTPGDPVGPNPWLPIPDEDIDITGDDFQDLLDALNEHCIHLQNSIESNISQLWDLQSDFLSSSFEDLKSYLHELFVWLSEQLNFDVTVDGGQYDDTSVVYWLKQIWSKLGDGINTKPVDPVINPNGWWDWFSGLLSGLIGSLADIGLNKLGGLVDALDTLREKFPFCVPWDIAALLGLLVSDPIAPEIELPLMALSGSEGVTEVGSMVIDLDYLTDPWEAVRWIERIAFCVYLATRTKDFLDLLGKIKG